MACLKAEIIPLLSVVAPLWPKHPDIFPSNYPPPPAPPNPVHGQHPANRKDTMGIKEEQGYQRGVQYLTVGTKEGCRT